MGVLDETYTLANGTIIPKLGFGTWLLKEGDECYDAVATALQLVYRHIDTARAYHNENSVGRAVRDSGIPREEIYVTSKLPAEVKDYDLALESFETTMSEIGLDHIDLYLVHAPWPWDEMGKDCSEENKVIWKAMEEFLASGRVKAIGVSNFSTADLESLIGACTVKPMVDQIQWFIGLDQSETAATCAEHGILIEAYSPFAHGRIVNHPVIVEMGARYEVSAPQLSLRYLLQKGTLPLPKATKEPHIRANAQVDFVISDADMAVLDSMHDTEKHPDAAEFRWS